MIWNMMRGKKDLKCPMWLWGSDTRAGSMMQIQSGEQRKGEWALMNWMNECVRLRWSNYDRLSLRWDLFALDPGGLLAGGRANMNAGDWISRNQPVDSQMTVWLVNFNFIRMYSQARRPNRPRSSGPHLFEALWRIIKTKFKLSTRIWRDRWKRTPYRSKNL